MSKDQATEKETTCSELVAEYRKEQSAIDAELALLDERRKLLEQLGIKIAREHPDGWALTMGYLDAKRENASNIQEIPVSQYVPNAEHILYLQLDVEQGKETTGFTYQRINGLCCHGHFSVVYDNPMLFACFLGAEKPTDEQRETFIREAIAKANRSDSTLSFED